MDLPAAVTTLEEVALVLGVLPSYRSAGLDGFEALRRAQGAFARAGPLKVRQL